MINLMSNSGKPTYGTNSYLVDSIEDIQNLPTDVAPGSQALCLSPFAIYLLSPSKTWVALGDETELDNNAIRAEVKVLRVALKKVAEQMSRILALDIAEETEY